MPKLKRKQTILLAVATLSIFIISILINSGGFILLAVSLILIICVIISVILKLKKNLPVAPLLKTSVIYLCVLIVGVILGFFTPYPEVIPEYTESASKKIEYLYKSCLSDKTALKTYVISKNKKAVAKRDDFRLYTAYNLCVDYENDLVELTNLDKYYLAFLLYYGKNTVDYEKAHKLASEVLQSGEKITNAEWLEKATCDKLQISLGKPQKYGIQHGID